VHPPGRFGALRLDEGRVNAFAEKPQDEVGWINGGFFVLEPSVIALIEGDDTSWEGKPLETLAQRGELMAYQHKGFWQPVDTLRDKMLLEKLWETGKAPWRIWE
jgi:glucose-1-phosphate cytidylyltransferase